MSFPLRTRLQLTGPWKIKNEPDRANSQPPWIAPEFDDGDWREIPPASHIQPWLYPDNPYWGRHVRSVNESAWWYRTRFQVTDLKAKRNQRHFRLLFEAVDYEAQVWLNGQRLGQHEGGFTPFYFEVTDLLQQDNVLVVKVTSPWDAPRKKGLTYADEVYRGLVKGLYAHADGLIPPDVNPIGIWRPVWLETHNIATIERVPFSVREDEYDRSAQVTLRLHIHNRDVEPIQDAVLHIYMAGERAPEQDSDILLSTHGVRVNDNWSVLAPPGDSVIEQTVRIGDPHWWWPWDLGEYGDRLHRPDRYLIRCTLYDGQGRPLDIYEQVVGLRQVRLMRSKTDIHYQVNKTPIMVRGVTYMGGLYLSQLTPAQIEADLDQVQECGLNLIRLHVHVAPPELYEACDRRGIMIWQDFELNWVHEWNTLFETRAVRLLHEMVDHLENHCAIITWCCHNEPNALSFQDRNLTARPDPRLYRELLERDPDRPVFISSGRNEADWLRSGDTHSYIGGGHGGHYADVYGQRARMLTEFGCEAPPTLETLNETPLLRERLAHLVPMIENLHRYQAELVKYQTEWYRRTSFDPCGGYIYFMLVDLYPQVGCGVLDVKRRPRPAFEALKTASQPVHVMLEYNRAGAQAIWVINDTHRPLLQSLIEWQVSDKKGNLVTRGSAQSAIPAQRAFRIHTLDWKLDPARKYQVVLRLTHQGRLLDQNVYDDPFHMSPRPPHFPWGFDPVLGMRCFGGPRSVSSLKVLNTWYGRLARWLFPVYRWAEEMLLEHRVNLRLDALLRRLLG